MADDSSRAKANMYGVELEGCKETVLEKNYKDRQRQRLWREMVKEGDSDGQ